MGEDSKVVKETGVKRESVRAVQSLEVLNTCYLTQEVVEQVPWVFLRVLVVVC